MEAIKESLRFQFLNSIHLLLFFCCCFCYVGDPDPRKDGWNGKSSPQEVGDHCGPSSQHRPTGPPAFDTAQPQTILSDKPDEAEGLVRSRLSMEPARHRTGDSGLTKETGGHREGQTPATKLDSIRNSDKKHFHCQAPDLMFKAKKSLGKQESVIYRENHYRFLMSYTLLGHQAMILR